MLSLQIICKLLKESCLQISVPLTKFFGYSKETETCDFIEDVLLARIVKACEFETQSVESIFEKVFF